MGAITDSFTLLKRLALTFEGVESLTAKHRRSALRWAISLGDTAVPLCSRELRNESDLRAEWAYSLLIDLADAGFRRRVLGAARDVASSSASDQAKLRAIAILTDLGQPPTHATLADPDAARTESMRKLAGNLEHLADVAQAATMVLTQLQPEELPSFLSDLADADERGLLLAAEVLIREDLDPAIRTEVELLLRAVELPALRTNRCKRHCVLAQNDDGQRVVISWRRRRATSPARYRSASALLAADGSLTELHYGDNLKRADVEDRLLAGFRERGFAVDKLEDRAAADLVLGAISSHESLLPTEFYLARDMFGLGPVDHLPRRAPLPLDAERAVARAFEAYRDGDLETSLRLFENLRDPHGRAQAGLGLCALAKGELDRAEEAFGRAIASNPEAAENFWNLAALSHKRGCRGSSFIALTAFVERAGPSDPRLARARAFLDEYERHARLKYPDADSMSVAIADREDHLGRRAVGDGDFERAQEHFLRATRRVSDHVPAWTDLGLLLARLGRSAEARICVRRALMSDPSYAPARTVLDFLDSVKRAEARPS